MSDWTRTYLAALVSLVVVLRVIWFGEFFALSLRRSRQGTELHWWDKLRADSRLPARLRGDDIGQHERYDLYKTQQVAAFTLGGLALAAWTVLATGTVATETRRLALAMLAVTVLTSIGTPILFRMAGGELSRMGFESGLAVAGLALVIGMLALSADTFHGPWMVWAATGLPGLLALREILDTALQMKLTATGVFGSAAATPGAANTPTAH